MKRLGFLSTILIGFLIILSSCNKDTVSTVGLYTPSTTDVTTNATLTELQQGRNIYISNCSACHSLYSPDDFNSANWSSILSVMAPRAGLSKSDQALVLKYVTRGK